MRLPRSSPAPGAWPHDLAVDALGVLTLRSSKSRALPCSPRACLPCSCDLSSQGHVCLGLCDGSDWHRSALSPWVGDAARQMRTVYQLADRRARGRAGGRARTVFCCDPCAFSTRAVLMCVHLPQVCVCVSVFVTEKGFHESQRTFLPMRHKYSLA